MEMIKRREEKDDGRYIIYYEFKEEDNLEKKFKEDSKQKNNQDN